MPDPTSHPHQSVMTMPPRLNLFSAPRALAYRPRKVAFPTASRLQQPIYRTYASGDLPAAEGSEAAELNRGVQEDRNNDATEHVSEEAAKMAQITGGEGPDLNVGTPVQEVGCST